MRYLAIAPGTKRTGLAAGDDETALAGPVGVIETADTGRLVDQIAAAAEAHGAEALVVGIPFNMDGTAGPAAERARRLAQALAERTQLPVHEFDERLSSYEADRRMARSGFSHGQKKARRDAIAAAAILQDFLDRAREP